MKSLVSLACTLRPVPRTRASDKRSERPPSADYLGVALKPDLTRIGVLVEYASSRPIRSSPSPAVFRIL